MKLRSFIPAVVLVAGFVTVGASPALAGPGGGSGATCTGSLTAPGTLVGNYTGNVTINGLCAVDAGSASVSGNLTVSPGSALVAAFAPDDLSVGGSLFVRKGATLIMGCEPNFFTCLNDPTNTLTATGTVGGNLQAADALAVVIHSSTIGGNVSQANGGGGQTCNTPAFSPTNSDSLNVWAVIAGSAPYSDYEDSVVHGNETVSNLATCWLGTARGQIGGNLVMTHNRLNDPDGIEILANNVAGNLVCQTNSQVWDSAEANFGQTALYPRISEPNTVGGNRVGQCVLASPTSPGGPSGPGPF